MDIDGEHFATDEFAFLEAGREQLSLSLAAGDACCWSAVSLSARR